MKDRITQEIDKVREELLTLSHNIRANPELGFQEFKAVAWQTELLREHGFMLECPFAGMETAYKATFKGKGEGPRLAILAEYDALKGVGHACGHNIMAACAVGAGIGLSKVMADLAGDVIVLGTPAEEAGGGKVIFVDRGVFEEIGFALIMHPGGKNIIGRGGLAVVSLEVEFFGKAAHSSSPEKGVNALTSVINLFNNINAIRQTWKPKEGPNINGIITKGGEASNIIPEHAVAEFTVRANTRKYLLKMMEDIKVAVESAAMITGTEYKIASDILYAERYPNLTMGETFKKNMETLGEIMHYPDPMASFGSSDIGNVSIEIPTIHEYLEIAPDTVNAHSEGFREAAISSRGDEVVLLAAKGLAMTAYDIFIDANLRERILEEFKKQTVMS
ncbi:MAG: M20 family metallopeptidase [Desulfitobacterium hafniense]|nr:M20 family metallopeptidase [Desulfitobacterium hafniense]